MSIQLTITFAALISLCGILGMLLVPLPTRVLASFVSAVESAMANKQVKVVAIMFTVITSLSFFDALRVGVLQGRDDIVEFGASAVAGSVWDLRAKKFYSQRNMYIYGFILYLEVALVFISMLIKSTLKNKTKLADLAENGVASDLQTELEAKKRDVATLKAQYANNAKAYDAAFESKPIDKSE